MLVRISCSRCRLSSLWTDEPHWFLSSVCLHLRKCRARLLEEDFATLPASRAGSPRGPDAQTAVESPPATSAAAVGEGLIDGPDRQQEARKPSRRSESRLTMVRGARQEAKGDLTATPVQVPTLDGDGHRDLRQPAEGQYAALAAEGPASC